MKHHPRSHKKHRGEEKFDAKKQERDERVEWRYSTCAFCKKESQRCREISNGVWACVDCVGGE